MQEKSYAKKRQVYVENSRQNINKGKEIFAPIKISFDTYNFASYLKFLILIPKLS